MTAKQLRDLRASARATFLMYEGRLFDLRNQLDGEADGGDFASTVVRFVDVHFLFEETKAFYQDYEKIQQALTNYLAGQPFDPYQTEGEGSRTIWEYCLSGLCGEGSRYWLIQPSDFFVEFASSEYERTQAMHQAFDKFFGDIPKGLLVNGNVEALSVDAEAQMSLQQDLAKMELSFAALVFQERMQEAQRLCEQKADPAQILQLFPK